MTIQTDLSVSPYFDDYNESKDFYKILFRPGVAVQTREINQLQTILQKQIERFGNNIYKQGTIIDGCDITFHNDLKYIKIKDIETDSTPVNVKNYSNYRLKNQSSDIALNAVIISSSVGFESTTPNLNTLYVRYLNSGFNASVEQLAYNPSELLTVYDPDNIIEKININNGSVGFSLSDRVVILSALAVQNTSGGKDFEFSFLVGETITDGTARAIITEIDTTTLVDSVILKIKPILADLKTNDPAKWTFSTSKNIYRESTPTDVAKVSSIVGSGATGTLTLTNLGEVKSVNLTNKGTGYTVAPAIFVASTLNTLNQIELFSATTQNFLTKVTVAGVAFNPIGNSYGVTVGEGIVYQKGYFSRVSENLVIVEKYNNLPDLKVIGFETIEDIITSNQDTSLLDNATGAPNATAPGANRLRLTPGLVTITKAEADTRSDFLYIAEFANGNPYKQNRQTVYNIIGKEISRRSYEGAGNYVLDKFLLTTKSSYDLATEATKFNIFIDPGAAYINGNRVETVLNYEAAVDKGTDLLTTNNGNISLNYGSYVKVNQYGGSFLFKTGDLINLYSTPGLYVSTAIGSTPSSSGLGTLLGTARIRSVVFDSGIAGNPDAIYRVYLFDIRVNAGSNFANVGSLFYDGTTKGICDTVLENGNAVIKDNNSSSLIFYAGRPAVNEASAVSYIYRTTNDQTLTTAGKIIFSVPSAGSETFPYTGQLSTVQERDVIIVPLVSVQSASALTGTVTCTSTSTAVTGSTTLFNTELQAGDFIKVNADSIGQVKSIANNTALTLVSNATSSNTGTYKLLFPANIPIAMDRSNRTITNNGSSNELTIDLGVSVNTQITAAVAYNVRANNVGVVTKSVNRNNHVRLRLANNATTNVGPWPIGVSDVFRLNKITKGANSTFVESSTDVTDVTQYFYIDHNQNEDYLGISYLYLKPNAPLALNASNDWLLISFDYFTNSGEGVKAPGGSSTYNINDNINLASSVNSINTLEIPEVYGNRGNYYDLRDQFDFRPSSNNAIIPTFVELDAPINPTDQTNVNRFSAADKKFPAPDSELSATIDYYIGRTDRVIIDESNEFRVLKGTPGMPDPAPAPDNALTINLLKIPPYPSVPFELSDLTVQFVDTKIANQKYTTRRLNNYRINTTVSAADNITQQPRGYSMQDIGKLERRISDLEYYTSLSLTETIAQKRVIPGFDGTDRFKFGFFVDGFEDYKFAETSNPGYNASIVDGYLSPKVSELNINLSTNDGDSPTLPYIEKVFISQSRATDGPITAVTTANVAVQSIISIQQTERNTNRSSSGNVYEEFFYTMSTTNGPVEFYINARDNHIGAEIFQSTTPDGSWVSVLTSAKAQAITQNDVNTKGLYLNGGRTIEHLGSLDLKTQPNASWGNFIEDQFKLLWSHNADLGVYYKIRIYKGKRDGLFQQGKPGTFEYKLFYPTDSTVNTVTTQPTTNYLLTYHGMFAGLNPYVKLF